MGKIKRYKNSVERFLSGEKGRFKRLWPEGLLRSRSMKKLRMRICTEMEKICGVSFTLQDIILPQGL